MSLKQKYADFAERNKKVVGMNEIAITCLLMRNTDVVSKSTSRKYNMLNCCTLNRKDITIKVTGADDKPSFEHTIQQHSNLTVNFFDKEAAKVLNVPGIYKIFIRADSFDNSIRYKAASISPLTDKTIHDPDFFETFIRGGPLGEIPTAENIPHVNESIMKQKYMIRYFCLPLSNETKRWTNVFPILDLNDPRRFVNKSKENPTENVPCVNMELGHDKCGNFVSFMFGERTLDHGEKSYVVKFGFVPSLWSCFGMSSTEKWTKCAGTMITHAKGWYAFGNANLEDMSRLCSNSEIDEGFEINGENKEEKSSVPIIGSQAYISTMTLNLAATIKNCGMLLPKEWVLETYALKNYSYQMHDQVTNPTFFKENPLNVNCHNRIKLPHSHTTVYNVTEILDSIRQAFFDNTEKLPSTNKLEYYGIFATGTNSMDITTSKPVAVFAIVSS